MPLYVVRWPNLSAALVRAADEDELVDHLDQLSSPTGCTWRVYNGPIHIEFELPVEFDDIREGGAKTTTDVVLKKFDGLWEGTFDCHVPLTDNGMEMWRQVKQFAFPNISAVFDDPTGAGPTEEQVRAAVHGDLEVYVRATWQDEHLRRSDDPDARIALMLRTSLRQVKNILKRPAKAPPGKVHALRKGSGKKNPRGSQPPRRPRKKR
jgi:hypothetical protein